ncbi:hypothetical protein Tsubulata_045822 [Turnera subulata]|uniref:ARM repeat superfamily protein n=1 Tax=Turnera subulata TaxID=218843 RepID=A0A9Q0G8G5_9ROSI|nr:hypothetical protein Tsubulata_045822 [Turnera subulata]
MEKQAGEEQQLMWKSESESQPQPESMICMTIGQAMTTLLTTRTKKLLHAISSTTTSTRPPPLGGSLEDSLWLLRDFIQDNRRNNLHLILIPVIENCLVNKEYSKRGGQAIVLVNWLFQDEFVFEAVSQSLAGIIQSMEDRYLALGWCVLVRSLVEYESFLDQYQLHGIRDNYDALLKVLSSCTGRLSSIVCDGSTLKDGFELPSRLSLSAADCILSISVALTKATKVPSNNPKSLNSNVSGSPISLSTTAKAEKKVKSSSQSSKPLNIEMAYLLWNQMEDLKNMLQKLLAWSTKSRPLHAKGVEQVLKWLHEIEGHYGQVQDEAGAEILKTGAMLLSSCWRHYGNLLHLEDLKFSRYCNELLDQYISGIQYYANNQADGHLEHNKSGEETTKFFLNCLCLLLGRFDSRKLESCMSEYGTQISSVLLSQFHCADEDVIATAVFIIKAAIFKPNTSGAGLLESKRMGTLIPLLLHLLDERDGTARAVTMLIAEYCSMNTDNECIQEVLKRLASGNASQRRNAVDVISELVHISADSSNKHSHLPWQEIADNLLGCLNDEEIAIREQSSSLLSMIEPSCVLPALVHLAYSSKGEQSSASVALIAMLRYHNRRPEVVCMLLDCLSNLSQSLDLAISQRATREEPKADIDHLLKLIPEWSKSVQDWKPLIGPLIDKMFAEPANATLVRFLSYISENLAQAANEVLYRVLLEMKGHEEWESRTGPGDDSENMQHSLFKRLCPLLIVRLLPLRVFNDLNLSVMYDQLHINGITYESDGDINIVDHECVAAFLLKRAFSRSEFEDIRKLAAELCGRIHPQVLFPIVSFLLQHAASSHDALKIKACLFSVCTSIVVRGMDSISHTAVLEIRRVMETILLWPSSDGDEVSKAQHGCIDCLALMICAELQALPSSKESSKKFKSSGGTGDPGNSVLTYVIHELMNDKNEVVSSVTPMSENCVTGAAVSSFRLCMANVLISTCQKISNSGKKYFAQKVVPCLVHSVKVLLHPEIRAACIQVLFSAVHHLRSLVLPYSSDLLKLSLKFLQEGSEKERMAAAKLMASLMASEDVILESIFGELLEARSVLSSVCLSDPSQDLRQICKKLLLCITAP